MGEQTISVDVAKGQTKATVWNNSGERLASSTVGGADDNAKTKAVAYALSAAGFYTDERVVAFAKKDRGLARAVRLQARKAAR